VFEFYKQTSLIKLREFEIIIIIIIILIVMMMMMMMMMIIIIIIIIIATAVALYNVYRVITNYVGDSYQ
jgi:hypothetical protein